MDIETASRDQPWVALSRVFIDEGTPDEVLQRMAELACRAAPADMASITVLADGRPVTQVCTDPVAAEICHHQYDAGRGPCFDAVEHQQVLRLDSIRHELRWPEFAEAASSRGVLSSLSVPIGARGERLGALNLFARRAAAFDDGCVESFARFADHAAIVLTNARAYWEVRQLSENLNQAMRSRATIDYAIGIIMAGGGRSPEDAFQVLVRASQRENRKLRDIASELVERASHRVPHPPASS